VKGLLSVGPLILERLVASWRLLAVLAFGVLVASTLMAVSPVYTRVMNDLGLRESLQEQIGGSSRNGFVLVPVPLGDAATAERERQLARVLTEEIGWFTGYEVRYGALPPMTLAREGEPAPTAVDRTLTSLHSMSGFDGHVRFVDGRAPRPTDDPSEIEALLPGAAAAFLKAKVGDRLQATFTYDDCNRPEPTQDPEQARELQRFRCTPQTFVEARLTFTVVGIVERLDTNDPFWTAGGISFNRPEATEMQGPVVPVVLPEASFFQAVPKVLGPFPSEFRLFGMVDIARLNSANLKRAQDSLTRLRERIVDMGAVPDVATSGPLQSFQNRASFNQVSLLLLLIQVVGIAVYYVLLVAMLLAERRSEEIAMLRSRGATVAQLVAMSAAEAAAIGLAAAAVAPFIASGAIAALGKTSTFEPVSGGAFLPFTIVPVSFLFALGGAAIAAVAVVIPAFFAARRGMVVFLRGAARPGKSLLQRYYLDFALAGCPRSRCSSSTRRAASSTRRTSAAGPPILCCCSRPCC